MLSRRDRKFLDLALRVAEASECNQKHGAVVVKGGRVMAVGINKMRNDPMYVESDNANGRGTVFSTHSEIDALSRVKDPAGSVMYVARLARSGEAFSRPCDNCAKALMAAGVKMVVYT